MTEELSLLSVIVILFLADLFVCGKEERGLACAADGTCAVSGCGCHFRTVFPVLLMLVHTVINLVPCARLVPHRLRPLAECISTPL